MTASFDPFTVSPEKDFTPHEKSLIEEIIGLSITYSYPVSLIVSLLERFHKLAVGDMNQFLTKVLEETPEAE